MTDNEKEPQTITHVNVPFKSGELSPAVPESPPQLPTVPEEPSLMNLIAEMARGGNVETLEKLINLQNSQLDREAKKEFARDFIRMKPHLPLVIAINKNSQTNSQYAKLENINKVIDPILEKYHFGTMHKIVSQSPTWIQVRIILWHASGHTEETELGMPPDDSGIAGKVNKTAPHAIASTIMYLRRVGECALLNISTGQDVDGNGPKPKDEPITTEQAVELDVRLRAISEKALPSFLAWAKNSLGVEALTDIRLSQYQRVVKAIANMETEAEKAKVQ